MKRSAWLALALAFLPPPAAAMTPAPQPVGWPSDICHAVGSNVDNPMCGTCSHSVVYSTPELGTYIGWVCREPNGHWRTVEIVRPWLARWFPAQGPGLAAVWAANVVVATAADDTRYAQLIALARPHLADVWRPPEVAPTPWIVAPTPTRLRPSFLVDATGKVTRETGKSIPTGTPAAPTACACDSAGDRADFGVSKLCRVPNFLTAAGQARFAACVLAPK